MMSNLAKTSPYLTPNQPFAQANQTKKQSSLMAMMRQIMQKSYLLYGEDELYYIAQDSRQYSESIVHVDTVNKQLREKDKDEMQAKLNCSENLSPAQDELSQPFSTEEVVPCHSQKLKISHTIPVTSYKVMDCSSLDNQYAQPSNTSPSHQFSELIEITARCIEYYNKFTEQKTQEFQIIQKTFTDLNNGVNSAFEQIIQEAVKKQHELRLFLHKKYQDIVKYKNCQDERLRTTLQEINQIHRINLLRSKDQEYFEDKQNSKGQFLMFKNRYQSLQKQQKSYLSPQLHNYAQTLNSFYTIMQDIQKSNFKQMVEETVSFINNLVTEEIKSLLYEKIPYRLTEKKIGRDYSTDFFMQSNLSYPQIKSNNFNILDIDSFTKLFMQSSRVNDFDKQKLFETQNKLVQDQMSNDEAINVIKCVKQTTNQSCSPTKQTGKNYKTADIKENNLQQKVTNTAKNNQTETSETTNINKKNSHPYSQKPQTKSTQRKPHPLICKKVTTAFQKVNSNASKPLSLQKSSKNNISQNSQKQSSLQQIKKISNQQNNRSAKINNYLYNFQDATASKCQQNITHKLSKAHLTDGKGKTINYKTTKRPNSKTPPKTNKSRDTRTQTANAAPNGLRTSPHPSLKTSINYTSQVSEFKINSGRKQSMVYK